MTWTERRLDELGYVSRGRSRHRPRDDASLYGGNYPFIQTGDVKHSQFYIRSYTQTYNEKGLAQSRLWSAGTLCITIAANIADTAILSFDACFPDSIIGFIANPHICDVRYIKYFFDTVQTRYKQIAQGAAQDNLSLQKLLTFPILTPPLTTQQRIADILSTYDNLIDNNNRRIALLEESIHQLYKEWFVRLRFPGYESVKIVDSIPEGWEKCSMAKHISTQYGYTETAFAEAVGPKFLRGTDINKKSYIDWSTVPYCRIDESLRPHFELRKHDILMIRMADPGKIGIVERDLDAVFASYLVRLSIRTDCLLPYYLFYFLRSDWYQGFITGASTGTTRKTANAKLMTSVDIMLPPIILQKNFSDYIEISRKQINKLLIQNEKLKEARDLLLPRLMNGSIAV